MRILLTGANGFLGGHILAGLRARGHAVVAAVRDPGKLSRQLPGIEAIACDFNCDTDAATWLPRLAGIDAVINCAGVLQPGRGQSIRAIHTDTPRALFDACVQAGVRRVVQISAVGVDPPADTLYARTKKAADDHLMRLDLDWIVLRPSLVYAQGSHGGTSLMRGLAGLPLVILLVGDGGQVFRPVHVDDLVETIARVLADARHARQVIEVAGPQRMTLREILLKLRAWLGLPPARIVAIPIGLIRHASRLGDLFGGPLSSTSLRQMQHDVAGRSPDGDFATRLGFVPRAMADALAASPAQVQDRWHARLYFAGPLLRVVLALMWIVSGIVGLIAAPSSWAAIADAMAHLGLPAAKLAYAFSCLDIAIGGLVLLGRRPRLLALIQLVIVAGYTVGLTVLAPSLWLDPFGALLKNLPVLAAIAIWAILEERR